MNLTPTEKKLLSPLVIETEEGFDSELVRRFLLLWRFVQPRLNDRREYVLRRLVERLSAVVTLVRLGSYDSSYLSKMLQVLASPVVFFDSGFGPCLFIDRVLWVNGFPPSCECRMGLLFGAYPELQGLFASLDNAVFALYHRLHKHNPA